MKKIVSALFIVSICATSASASIIITRTDSFGLRDADWVSGTTGTNLTVSQLSSSEIPDGYSLSAINVTLLGDLNADFSITNQHATEDTNYYYTQEAFITLYGPSNSLEISADPIAGEGDSSNRIELLSGETDNYLDVTADDSNQDSVGESYWNLYTGGGNVVFNTTSTSDTLSSTVGGTPQTTANIESAAGIEVDYVLTPEPSSLALLLVMSNIFLFKRRRSGHKI